MRRALPLLLLLAGCGSDETVDRLPPPPSADAPLPAVDISGLPVPPARGNLTPADNAPLVYMGLQREAGGVLAITFVIDGNRDGDPYNDPAAELRPAEGQCNLTDIETHTLPAEYAAAPVFGPDQVREGVTPDLLPAFMAIAVSEEMIRLGLAESPGDTQPQNVCTRKYWERLVAGTARGAG